MSRSPGPTTYLIAAKHGKNLNCGEQTATTTHHHQQTTTAVVVLLVGLEVIGELVDARREERDLHLGRARVGVVQLVGADGFVLVDHDGSLPVTEVAAAIG